MKYNVLFINYSSDIAGGGQVSLLELLRLINRDLFNPLVLVNSPGEMEKKLRDLEINTIYCRMPSIKSLDIFGVILSIIKIIALIKKKNIPLIHTNDTRAHFYGGLVSKITGIASIFHFRVSYSDYWNDHILPLFCSQIIAVSHSVSQRFKKYQNKTNLIYNGVDINLFKYINERCANDFSLKYQNPVIGSIGRLEKAKGMHILIRAVAKLKDEFPSIGVIIIGKGTKEYKNSLEQLGEELSIGEHIQFLESYQNIPLFMSNLDIYTLLSDNEGLNRSLIEAMACERCVVSTNVGGNPEIINNDSVGFLVPFNNHIETANVFKKLLNNDNLRKQIGKAARKRVMETFNIYHNVKKTEDLYRKIVS